MIRICVIDGGGAKGLIPLVVIKKIEEKIGKPFYEIFDMFVGSSVGAIIAGMLASGRISASDFLKEMEKELPKVFHWRLRIPLFQPKYDKKNVIDLMLRYIDDEYTMSQCKSKFMCTSVSTSDGRTHFFKSWEEKDGKIPLIEAVSRSFAAPYFFGGIVDKRNKTMWMDGGTGLSNCPLNKTFIEINRQGWEDKKLHVLSLGCGHSDFSIPYKKIKNFFNIRQILFYSSFNNNLARKQSTEEQILMFKNHAKNNNNLTFQRLDVKISKKEDGLDKIRYIPEYRQYGESLSKKVDYGKLQ